MTDYQKQIEGYIAEAEGVSKSLATGDLAANHTGYAMLALESEIRLHKAMIAQTSHILSWHAQLHS